LLRLSRDTLITL
jgi:hypothetical protein